MLYLQNAKLNHNSNLLIMKKIVVFVLIAVVLILGLFYFQFQKYFVEDRVDENLPEMATKLEPKILKRGNFVDADFIHKGTGMAYILESPEGGKILRFENLDITNGPDLFVYLAETKTPTGDLKSLGNYIDLGRLKGNIGNQNYELPADITGYNSIVIWCKKFDVLFPYAILN